ncbi:MAG: SDR family NAD(P)-dependent oxidoreductase [Marinibacterium sp.]
MHILITGGNRGIGAGLAEAYRAAGHMVLTTARDGSGDFTVDVADPAQIATMADQLSGQEIDLLICNAGVYLDKGADLDTGYAPDLWARTFAVNVTGVFLTIQALLPNLRSAGGKIAILGSMMASQHRAPGGSYIYRASKAAVLNLGRNLASDLAGDGVAVGVYHPGWVQTDMGGNGADIPVDMAVPGLIDRFDALSVDTTGVFEGWDGEKIAY